MSPLEISLLLRAYCCKAPNGDLPHGQAYAPAMRGAAADFIRQGLFQNTVTPDALYYGLPHPDAYLTEKGRALVDKLQAVEPDAPSASVQLYKDGIPVRVIDVPTEVLDGARRLADYLAGHPDTTVYGMGDVSVVAAERDEWKNIYEGQKQVYLDIGKNLGAKIPEELINNVARRRMQELAEVTAERDALQRQLVLADALINRLRGLA